LVLVFLVISYGPGPHTEEAEATFPTIDYANIVQTTITAVSSVGSYALDGISSAALASLELKEWTFDGIAFALTNIIIQNLTRSIVEWINSGFQGSPAFVTDLDGFLLDVADIQAGRFLTELGLGVMCSPFKLDVQIALALQYQKGRKYEAQCRLSDVVNNIDGFLNGDMRNTNWQGWFELTARPGNNPYGALVLAQTGMSVEIRNKKGERQKLLDFGRGFFSFESCEEVLDAGSGDVIGEECTIQTPGDVIEEQLNNNLDSGRERLIIADEINEILGALFAQLVQQVFTGAGGLLGLTSSGYTPQGFSYIQASTDLNQPSAGGLETNTVSALENAINLENRYIAAQQQVVSIINTAEEYLNNSSAAGSLSFPGSLANRRSNALSNINSAQSNQTFLTSLAVQYESTNDPQERLEIYQVFIDLRTQGTLHDEVELAQLQIVVTPQIQEEANTFMNTVDEFTGNQNNNNNSSDSDNEITD
jgi:hypothetical protein